MKTRSRFLLLLLLSAATVRADSVTLVTGEKVSGTIKSETEGEVVIDVPISGSIIDERVIRKEDIAKEEKTQPDELAYKALVAVQPNPEISYASDTYVQILASLNDFESKYPNSTYLPEVKKLAAVFQDEKKRVDDGQVKYLGQWLSQDEAARRSIQIESIRMFEAMQQQAASGDLLAAMQSFDTIEKQYKITRKYPEAVVLAQQVLARFKVDLADRMQQVKADQAQLKNTIAFAKEPERSNIIAAEKADQDRATAAVQSAMKSGNKWTPLIPRSQISIDTLQKTVASETTRLASIPVATMIASVQKVDAARNAMSTQDFESAASDLKEASQLWSANEAAHYWGDRLKEMTATPTPVPATPRPAAAHTSMLAPNGALAPGATAAAKSAVSPAASAASAAAAATPAMEGNSASQESSAVTPEAAPAESKPFFMTPVGAISIIVVIFVIGGIVALVTKKKPAGHGLAMGEGDEASEGDRPVVDHSFGAENLDELGDSEHDDGTPPTE